MSKLIVHNFGPLKDVEINTDKSIYMIGESASGKSTIAKLIYYFEDLYYQGDISVEDFIVGIKKYFAEMFDCSSLNSLLQYYYGADKYIRMNIVDGIINVVLSESLFSLLSDVCARRSSAPFASPSLSFSTPISYVPAGRSMVAVFADIAHNLSRDSVDISVREFINAIVSIRKTFNKPLRKVVDYEKQFVESTRKFDEALLHKIISLSEKLIHGEYRFEGGRNRLYFSDNESVDFSFASSGQQEAVWIVQIIFYLVLKDQHRTLIIEEPEAHLHPRAQYYLMQIIQVFANIPGNKVIITTHSPYILSCLNNLLYANKVGRVKPGEVNQIVDKDCWADVNKIDAYQLENGGVVDIMHRELEMVKIEILDEISEYVNAEYNKILDLDE